jgi:hypothetical protein
MCILPQFWCHHPPNWLSALPLNLTYIWPVPSKLSLGSTLYTNSLHSRNQILCPFLSLGSFVQRSCPGPMLCAFFVTNLFFYGEGLSAPYPTPKLEDHPLSFVHGCIFTILAATLYNWRLFLHPQPKDVSCCGDRDSPNMGLACIAQVIDIPPLLNSSEATLQHFLHQISLFCHYDLITKFSSASHLCTTWM